MRSTYMEEEAKIRTRYRTIMLGLGLLLIGTILLSFGIGYYPLTPAEVLGALAQPFGYTGEVLPQALTIFWSIRLPRILSAMFIGAALSVAGSVYQGMLRNPLISPDILGVSSGASLGAAIAILNGCTYGMVYLTSFAGAIIAVTCTCLMSRKSAYAHTLSLVLTGSMMMALCNAGVTMIKYVANPNDVLQHLTFWLMGSLTKVTMETFLWSACMMLPGFIIIFALRWRINLLTLDDDEAKTMGIHSTYYRILLIVASSLLSAAAVCLGGLIGWVGLMIPHMCRVLIGPDYRRLVPACAMLGAGYLVLMDDIARALLSLELPLGVVTSVVGAPFFIHLILRRKER